MRFVILAMTLGLGLLPAAPLQAEEAPRRDAGSPPAVVPAPADVIDAALLAPITEEARRLERETARQEPGPAPRLWPIGGAAKAYESPWSLKLGLAASMARGNTDTADVLVDGELNYTRNKVAAQLKAAYVYGQANGVQNAENWHVQARFDRKLRGKGYLFFKYMYDQDAFADLDYRHTALGGWGYTIIDREKTTLKGELGAGMSWEQRTGLAPSANPSAYVGLDFAHKWGEGNTFTLDYDFIPFLNDFDLSYMTWDAKFGTPVCQGVDITIGVRVNWVFDPPSPTKPVDLLLAAGIRLDV